MKEKIIDACFDEFIQEDSEELLELCDELAEKVLAKEKITRNFILDILSDVACAYETVAFKAGFEACIQVLGVLNGKENG